MATANAEGYIGKNALAVDYLDAFIRVDAESIDTTTVTGGSLTTTEDVTTSGAIVISGDATIGTLTLTSGTLNATVSSVQGDLTCSGTFTSSVNVVDIEAAINQSQVGTVGTGFTVAEVGTDVFHMTTITASMTLPITSGNFKTGVLLYTFPNKDCILRAICPLLTSITFNASNGSVTPEFGFGTSQASGASTTLSGTEEDIIAAYDYGGDLDATTTNQYYVTNLNFPAAGHSPTSAQSIYFNIAGNWSVTDANFNIAMTIKCPWETFES